MKGPFIIYSCNSKKQWNNQVTIFWQIMLICKFNKICMSIRHKKNKVMTNMTLKSTSISVLHIIDTRQVHSYVMSLLFQIFEKNLLCVTEPTIWKWATLLERTSTETNTFRMTLTSLVRVLCLYILRHVISNHFVNPLHHRHAF